MVGALHADGLQVVLDQVFNHTAASGQDAEVGPRPRRARLLPPAQRDGRGRDLDLLPEHRDRARDGREAHGRLGGHVGPRLQGRRLPLRPHGPPLASRTCRPSATRSTSSTAAQGRRRRPNGLPLRRGLELRRGGRQRACSRRPRRASSAGRASARSATGCATPSAAAARSTRTRASRASAPAACTDPNGAPVNGTEAEQLARAAHDADLVRLGLAGNLRDFAFLTSARHGPDGRRARLQRPAGRLRRLPGGGHHLRRRARQRDAVRRAHAQAADGHPDGGPGADEHRLAGDDGPGPDAVVLARGRRPAAQQVARPQQLQLRATGSTCSTCPARTTASAAACRRRRTTRRSGRSSSRCWPTRRSSRRRRTSRRRRRRPRRTCCGCGSPRALFRLGSADADRAEGHVPGLAARTPTRAWSSCAIDDTGWDRRRAGPDVTDARRRARRGQRVRRGDDADGRRRWPGDRLRALAGAGARAATRSSRATTWDRATGTVTVPARTVAVLVEQAGHGHGHGGGGWWWPW